MLCDTCKNKVGFVEGCKIHKETICMTYPPHCRNCGEMIMIEVREPPKISADTSKLREKLIAVATKTSKADYKTRDGKRICAECESELYWEGHPFLCTWKCPKGCKEPVESIEMYEIKKRDFEEVFK